MYAFYDNITLNWSDEEVEHLLGSISLGPQYDRQNKVRQFIKRIGPRYYRNSHGQLVPAKPGSPEAGYKRCPELGNRLVKV